MATGRHAAQLLTGGSATEGGWGVGDWGDAPWGGDEPPIQELPWPAFPGDLPHGRLHHRQSYEVVHSRYGRPIQVYQWAEGQVWSFVWVGLDDDETELLRTFQSARIFNYYPDWETPALVYRVLWRQAGFRPTPHRGHTQWNLSATFVAM